MIFSNPLLFFPLFLTLFPFTLGVTLPLVAPRVLTLLDSDKKLASDIIQFARTGYVDPVTIKLWKCGEPCDRVAPVYYEASGGNGNSAPNWFVLYWPAQNAIVINHQGTSPDKLGTVLIDLKISPRPLQIPPFNDISRGSPPDARVHTGFFGDYLTSANQIRVQVKSILKDGVTTPSGTKEMPDKIFVTGYSLGAAVAVLNALDLALSLPESIPVTAITIGTPKIGNKAFADWADKVLDPKRNIRIVNEKDIVPLLPPERNRIHKYILMRNGAFVTRGEKSHVLDLYFQSVLPATSMYERDLQSLIRGLRSDAAKKNESRFIAEVIDEIRKEIVSKDMDVKAGAVVKLIYLDMLGYDMSWASFHVVEVMSSQYFHLKCGGYLAAAQSFDQETDVLMLTTNLLKKDMASATHPDISASLNCLSHIVTPALAQDLSSDLIAMLNHSRPLIRKRAVLVLYKAFLRYPEALDRGYVRLREKLEDSDI
ncbi:AP-3 complex subunit delta, partial [Tulasnella sp. 403]